VQAIDGLIDLLLYVLPPLIWWDIRVQVVTRKHKLTDWIRFIAEHQLSVPIHKLLHLWKHRTGNHQINCSQVYCWYICMSTHALLTRHAWVCFQPSCPPLRVAHCYLSQEWWLTQQLSESWKPRQKNWDLLYWTVLIQMTVYASKDCWYAMSECCGYSISDLSTVDCSGE
jgi:hypothetical protein